MKKFITVLLIGILAFSLGACSPAEDTNNDIEDEEVIEDVEADVNEDNEEEEEDVIDNEEEVEETPEPTGNSQEVNLYFVNSKYVETGDESLDKLIPETRTIEYENTTLAEAVVKSLMEGPENIELSTLIPSTVKLLDVKVENGTANVNFAREGLSGGSMEENFTIQQIVMSLVELDEVDKIQFLVDGEVDESLMGHMDITDPFGIE